MAHTERFGLNQFGGSLGGDLADEGYKFSIRDRETIDRLHAAFEGHRHTGGLAEVWEPTTAYGGGTRILPTDPNGHVYLALNPGISASTEPTWPTGAAATVVDNEITWQEGGSEATTRLADPVGLPSAAVDDDEDASLPAGTDLYYRVGFVDAWGLETAGSDEILATTPDPLPTPDPPSAVTAAGGTLEDGPYYYAISFWQTDGNLETELSDTTYVTCELGNNTVELELPPLETGADGWRLYRLGPSEADLYLLDTQLAADGTDYSDDGSTAIVEPVGLPPLENTTNSRNKVTITAPDVVDDQVPAGVQKWRIYRSYLSGDYPDQSLVHEVVETTEMGGTILLVEWEDLGDPLLDGIPLDTSTTLDPPGPAATLLGNELPLADGTADPGDAGAASREDHVHPLYIGGTAASGITSAPTGTVAATNVQAAIAELEAEKLGLGTATPLVESGAGAVGSATLGSRQDHVHPAAGGGGGASELDDLDDVTIDGTPLSRNYLKYYRGIETTEINTSAGSASAWNQRGIIVGFTPTATETISRITLQFASTPPSGYITVGICSNQPADVDDTTWVGGPVMYPAARLVNFGAGIFLSAELSVPATLSAATTYWLVVQNTDLEPSNLSVGTASVFIGGAAYVDTFGADDDGVYDNDHTGSYPAYLALESQDPGQWYNTQPALTDLGDVWVNNLAEGEHLGFDMAAGAFRNLPRAVTATGGGKETLADHPTPGATETIDLADGNAHAITLDAATVTLTFAGATAATVCSMTLIVTQDGTGGRVIAWPGAVAWPGGVAPTLTAAAGAVDIFTFVTTDGGSTWYGFTAGLDF